MTDDIRWRGSDDLRPMLAPLDEMRLDEKNARVHSEKNLKAIELSLREHGQRKPIVVWRGLIIAGNGTATAAIRLGWTHIATSRCDDIEDEHRARAFAIMDNRSAELAEWDYQELTDTIKAMPEDLRLLTGYTEHELIPLVESVWTPQTFAEKNLENTSLSVSFAGDQAATIRRAVESVRQSEGDEKIPIPRALELICANYLSGR